MEAKQFIGKMRSRQVGMWFRPNCDTIFLKGIEMRLLRGWRGWKVGNVRSLAVQEFWFGKEEDWETWHDPDDTEPEEIWEALL